MSLPNPLGLPDPLGIAEKNLKTLHIIGRRWRDSNGNTYHTVQMSINGNPWVFLDRPTYGYGNHYLTTAQEYLEKEGWMPEQDRRRPLWSYCSDNNILLNYEAIDVSRKKDL